MRLALALIAAASIVASGCGEKRGDAVSTVPQPLGPPPGVSTKVVATAAVALVEYAVESRASRLPRAGRIAFQATNDGVVSHALAVDGPSGPVSTRALRPGERATITLVLPAGTYKWYCPIADHEQRGMVGRVRVAE